MEITWQEVLNKASGVRDAPMYRAAAVLAEYEENRRQVQATCARYSDYIKVKELNWVSVENAETGLVEARRTRRSKLRRLTLNAYPYHLEAGIVHMVLWSVIPMAPEEIGAVVRRQLKRVLKVAATDDMDVAFYVNRPEHQSILDLWHAQVFVRLVE